MLIIDEESLTTEKFFTFTIETAGGHISVNPKVPTDGLYAGGHARINNRGSGARWLVWEWETSATQPFELVFEELGSTGGDADGDVTDLFKTTEGPVKVDGKWQFKGKLRKGIGFETIAFKYTIEIAGFDPLDPLIIVDR